MTYLLVFTLPFGGLAALGIFPQAPHLNRALRITAAAVAVFGAIAAIAAVPP